MIRLENVTKRFVSHDALNNLSLTIKSGELFVLVGPSGSGKTTLLKMINRLNEPTTGNVTIDGANVKSFEIRHLRQNIGYVLQSGALFPNMTVAQNAAIQLETLGWDKQKRDQRIAELLDRVGLRATLFMNRMPSELSGGEAQRVGIVRALAAEPNIVLMDEPFSALDPISKRQLQDLVIQLHRELTTTFVFVTHDMAEAIKLADRLAVIHNGTLQQIGVPNEILAKPANTFVATFFGENDTQNIFLNQVVKAGFGQPSTEAGQILKGSDTIFDWAAQLKATPDLVIKVEQTTLRSVDLINYLASLEQEAR